jgi:hypothetical protein
MTSEVLVVSSPSITISGLVLVRVNMATYYTCLMWPARFTLTSEEDDRNATTEPLRHYALAPRARGLGEPRAKIYVAVFPSCSGAHDPLGRTGTVQ